VAPAGSPNVLYIVLDDVGFSAMEPWGGLLDDYPGERPFAFKRGTITEAVVDVSGEEYVDLEREALAMMKRE
jgi:arylsulfatase A-like enzyme